MIPWTNRKGAPDSRHWRQYQTLILTFCVVLCRRLFIFSFYLEKFKHCWILYKIQLIALFEKEFFTGYHGCRLTWASTASQVLQDLRISLRYDRHRSMFRRETPVIYRSLLIHWVFHMLLIHWVFQAAHLLSVPWATVPPPPIYFRPYSWAPYLFSVNAQSITVQFRNLHRISSV